MIILLARHQKKESVKALCTENVVADITMYACLHDVHSFFLAPDSFSFVPMGTHAHKHAQQQPLRALQAGYAGISETRRQNTSQVWHLVCFCHVLYSHGAVSKEIFSLQPCYHAEKGGVITHVHRDACGP